MLLEVEKNILKLKYFIICLDPLVVALQQSHVLVHRVHQVLQGLLVVEGAHVVLLKIFYSLSVLFKYSGTIFAMERSLHAVWVSRCKNFGSVNDILFLVKLKLNAAIISAGRNTGP